MNLVLVDAEKWVIEYLPHARPFLSHFHVPELTAGVEEGRAGRAWKDHFQDCCRRWCRLDLLMLMVAGNVKAGKTMRRPSWAMDSQCPFFPPGTGCLQLELSMRSGGFKCIQWGSCYRQQGFLFAL